MTSPGKPSSDALDFLQQQVAAILGSASDAEGPADSSDDSDEPAGLRSASLDRSQELGHQRARRLLAATNIPLPLPQEKFLPTAPRSIEASGLTENEIESLVLKVLLHSQTASGAEIAHHLALPFGIIDKLLCKMKEHRQLAHKKTTGLQDYLYELTAEGAVRARRCAEQCSYVGAAPVSLSDYAAAVAAQSIRGLKAQAANVRKAFSDLSLSEEMLEKVGRAVCSGKGLFLYGAPGNGKTCIAERITKAYGLNIWIPRALNAYGEIIRLYDPSNHVLQPLSEGSSIVDNGNIDHRWVRIQRPTIIVGGELTLDSLEIRMEDQSGIGEAPLQLKSNCGTLVIDDFGRQRVAPAELLNRWIIPLEKHYDFLSLGSGRKIQVPFNQFVIFSTNLEPKDLVDEAFLRRIPYKIDVRDPSEEQFCQLFAAQAARLHVAYTPDDLNFLIEHCYRQPGRAMRFCHVRDLLHQIQVFYDYLDEPARLSQEAIMAAADNYFSMV